MKKVSFVHMADGTAEDYRIIGEAMKEANKPLADDVLALLQENERIDLGYKVTRLEHSLQAASHAFRDNQSEEMVVAALLHDVGDTLAPFNHAQIAAGILRPYVSERAYWVVLHPGLFQTYYYNHHFGLDRNERDRFKGHPHYQACIDFCEKYDQAAFDPDYESETLEFFEPMVRRVMERPLASMYAKAMEEDG